MIKYDPAKDAPQNKWWRPLLAGYYDSTNFIAAHIVPYRLGPEVVDYLFGAGSGSRLNSPDNCMIIHRDAEHLLDNGSFVLMPADPSESPIRSWKIRITNSAAINADVGRKYLRELDNKEVEWKNENRPAARFLYFHFVITLLRNQRDRTPGWEKFLAELPTGKPFATMGPYLRKSTLMTLTRYARDLDAQNEAKILSVEDKELFDDGKGIEPHEEEEIARRVLKAEDARLEELSEDEN